MMIYHYCNKLVFDKITATKIVWLSDIEKMNDSGEYRGGFEIIREILNDYPDIDNSEATKMSPEGLNTSFKILIACFSRNGDVRSQWASYADDGLGFSIGFDLELVKQHNLFNRYWERMQPISSKIEFIEVNYDKEDFEKEARQLIEQHRKSESPIKFKLLSRSLMYLAIRYKDNFFHEEQEIRGFIAPENEVFGDDFLIEQREGKYGLTDFHQLNTSFKDIPSIREVIIGPKNPLTIEELRVNLIPLGLGDISIKYSDGRGKYR